MASFSSGILLWKGGNVGVVGDNGPVVTVVLLGWLRTKPKHLKRYVELYNSRGIPAVTFVASVRDVLWFHLGRELQQRISALAHELGSWLEESERDGRERLLIPHLQQYSWITAALLKKCSSSAYPTTEAREGLESEKSRIKMQQTEPLVIETILLVAFEKLFSFVLNLPDVKQRLTKVTSYRSTLLRNQPPSPQLYLYTTADKVIPSQSVELFMEKQRTK